MDIDMIKEMISILAKSGRPDLISHLNTIILLKKNDDESYEEEASSDSESISDLESDSESDMGVKENINVKVDEDGFYRISSDDE
tara:strand:+ start:1010 stop:1264 length:255 start_codon:yes stop_codon:yes gene_type:complete